MAQQFHWSKNYGNALSFLGGKNTRLCNKTGKSFCELIHHFIVSGDEMYTMADADGDLKIIGEAGKKKHEKNVSDYCGSITMYCTGNCAGNNWPTTFLMKGKKRKAGYADTFLQDNGAAVGSTIAMTENVFMTELACEEIADKLVE